MCVNSHMSHSGFIWYMHVRRINGNLHHHHQECGADLLRDKRRRGEDGFTSPASINSMSVSVEESRVKGVGELDR